MKKLPANVNKKRWAMYAAGAAVAAFSGAQTAEADIMHVVVPDGQGDVGTDTALSFNLGDNGAAINFNNTTAYYAQYGFCLLYTSPSPRDQRGSRMPSSA